MQKYIFTIILNCWNKKIKIFKAEKIHQENQESLTSKAQFRVIYQIQLCTKPDELRTEWESNSQTVVW